MFDESKIDISKFPLIDAHHHLWDLYGDHYPSLRSVEQGGKTEHVAGDYLKIKKNYQIKDYLHDTKNFNIVKSVHVQVPYENKQDEYGDIKWLQDQTNENDNSHCLPNGIVAYANLSHIDNLRTRFEEFKKYPNIRGIRQMLNWLDDKPKIYTMTDRHDYLTNDKWIQGYSLLQEYKLSFDLQIYQHQMVDAAQIARRYPQTSMILNHCGMPYDCDKFDEWKQCMSILAQQSNISCKISGLVMFQHQWTKESLKPYIEYCLQLFGTKRCAFGSNFPVDKINSTFDDLYKVYFDIAKESGLTSDEMKQVFCDNAKQIYRL